MHAHDILIASDDVRRDEMIELTAADLILIRSDTGDGGWSLHTKEQIELCEPDESPCSLISGPSPKNVDGDWIRPTPGDYAQALRIANRNA
jgi:hypothetical protein